jgi:hypothetical protein
MFGRKSRSLASHGMTHFFGEEGRVARERRNERDSSAERADIFAGAMMKEKASAHFARNDGRG